MKNPVATNLSGFFDCLPADLTGRKIPMVFSAFLLDLYFLHHVIGEAF